MNSFVVGIDLGEKESDACYMSPDGELRKDIQNSERRYSLKQE